MGPHSPTAGRFQIGGRMLTKRISFWNTYLVGGAFLRWLKSRV